MSDDCFSIEELGDIAGLHPRDPRYAHVEACAKCRALLASLREFREPSEIPQGANLEDAERRLTGALERELSREASSGESLDVRQREPQPESPLAQLLGWLWRPSLRPALAVGAAAILLVIVVNVLDFGGGPDRIVPRQDVGGQEAVLSLNPPQHLDDGRIRLSWEAAERADAYRVLLFDTELNEVTRLEAGSATSFVMEAVEIRNLAGAEGQLLWQVIALSGGDQILRSSPGGLRLP